MFLRVGIQLCAVGLIIYVFATFLCINSRGQVQQVPHLESASFTRPNMRLPTYEVIDCLLAKRTNRPFE